MGYNSSAMDREDSVREEGGFFVIKIVFTLQEGQNVEYKFSNTVFIASTAVQHCSCMPSLTVLTETVSYANWLCMVQCI